MKNSLNSHGNSMVFSNRNGEIGETSSQNRLKSSWGTGMSGLPMFLFSRGSCALQRSEKRTSKSLFER